MPVTVKLITEQTTNQLEASVNKAQTNGWYPVCGVVWFNARYTQLMAHDSDGTEVPKCNYFLVDSEDGIDFANRVNKLVALNNGASCLSSVQYVNARYIQAWGDDTLHHGGAAAVTWGFQVETSPDGMTWTPTPGSARYINLRGAGDNNVLQTVNLTAAVDIPAGTRVRITQMTDTSSANVGLVALPAMLGGATAAGLVFSLSTTV